MENNKGMWNQIPQTKEYILPLDDWYWKNKNNWIENSYEADKFLKQRIREVMELNMVMYGKW